MAIKEVQGTQNRPGQKGYVTTTFTGADVRKARGLLDEQAKAKKERDRQEISTWKNPVRNHRGSLKIVNDKSLQTIQTMQKANPQLYPKGPPSVRPTFNMPAYIKDGRVIREGDPDY